LKAAQAAFFMFIPMQQLGSSSKFTFGKTEKLKSTIAFGKLFSEGHTVKYYPLRMVYVPWQNTSPTGLQVGFSVSKKRFKHAVQRNRIKRQMREAYRLQRPVVLTEPQQQLALLFIYLHNQETDSKTIAEAVKKCLLYLRELQAKHTA
jgi:ribonuclease P protein component